MDVLVLGANEADMAAVTDQIVRAGHHVHRCAPADFVPRSGHDCIGSVAPTTCPLIGPIDVAVLVDSGPAIPGLQPTGLGCAVRDHLPLATILPGEDPVEAADAAMARRDGEWSDAIRGLTGQQEIRCSSSRLANTLRVEVSADVDEGDRAAVSRLGTRVYDVVRDQLPTGIHAIGVGIHGTPTL